MDDKKTEWYKVLDREDQLPEGRVMTATANRKGICLTHFEGKFSALNNRCPHQGGPLGEGSIENGLLRCPWHGWDFNPCTGQSPGGHDDSIVTYPVEVRDDGIYVGVEEEDEQPTTISDVMIKTMVEAGVDTVFGMVGHSNLGLADAMRKMEEKGELKFIGIRHEGAGAFAASAYGKLTGKPAACFGIAGPGATNMFTGMWDAKNDRAPMLVLSGQVQSQVVGTGAFQEVDLVSAFNSVADFNHRVLPNSKHSELMLLAIKHAIVNREVSHLTFPDDMQRAEAIHAEIEKIDLRIAPADITPPVEVVDKAVGLLSTAKRPVIIVGHGARFHMPEVIALAEKLNAPVLTTFKAKGQISDDHPLGCGVLGRSGTPIASWVMNEADLLCVFGASFSNHTGITSKIPTIQVDYDRMAIAKFHTIEVPVWGEIGTTARLLQSKLSNARSVDQRPDIARRWELWKREKVNRLNDDRGKGVSSVAIFEAMNRIAPPNAVMCVDVGNNAYSFGRYFESKEHSFIMSGYLGSIGFGYPAAIGAWMATKGSRPVIAVTGDGGFAQYPSEITTAVKYGMKIKHILINNGELGKISKEQRADELDVWQTSLNNPAWAEFASSCGALGIRVKQREELDTAMQKLFDHDGPAMLEVMADVNLI